MKIQGKEVEIDLNKISIREYRSFVRGTLTDGEDDAILARVTGMTADAIGDLPQPVYRRMLKAFIDKAKEPLADAEDPLA